MNTTTSPRACCLGWTSFLPAKTARPAAGDAFAARAAAPPLSPRHAPPSAVSIGSHTPVPRTARSALPAEKVVREARLDTLFELCKGFVCRGVIGQAEAGNLDREGAGAGNEETRLADVVEHFDLQCDAYRRALSLLRSAPALHSDPSGARLLALMHAGLPKSAEWMRTRVGPAIERLRQHDVAAGARLQAAFDDALRHHELACAAWQET